jgi:hypothetical protein
MSYRYWAGDHEFEDAIDQPGIDHLRDVECSEISVQEDILQTIRSSKFIQMAMVEDATFELLCNFVALEMNIEPDDWYAFQADVSEALIQYEYELGAPYE